MGGVLDLEQLKRNENDVEINLSSIKPSFLGEETDSPWNSNEYPEPVIDDSKAHPSFLKKEEPAGVSVSFSPTVKSKSNFFAKAVISLLCIGIISMLGFLSYLTLFQTKKNFYLAKWNGMLTAEEKTQGVKSLNYEFRNNLLVEKIVTESKDVEISAQLSSNINLVNTLNGTSTFKINKKSIDSIDIQIPDIYCRDNANHCLEIKQNFEKTFREKIEEQNKEVENKEFKITKIPGSKIKLESDVIGDRLLTLAV